jgi:hypothetical protein
MATLCGTRTIKRLIFKDCACRARLTVQGVTRLTRQEADWSGGCVRQGVRAVAGSVPVSLVSDLQMVRARLPA